MSMYTNFNLECGFRKKVKYHNGKWIKQNRQHKRGRTHNGSIAWVLSHGNCGSPMWVSSKSRGSPCLDRSCMGTDWDPHFSQTNPHKVETSTLYLSQTVLQKVQRSTLYLSQTDPHKVQRSTLYLSQTDPYKVERSTLYLSQTDIHKVQRFTLYLSQTDLHKVRCLGNWGIIGIGNCSIICQTMRDNEGFGRSVLQWNSSSYKKEKEILTNTFCIYVQYIF